jgi:mannose-6-phosphate isomerase
MNWADLIFCTDNNLYTHQLERYRDKGYPIFGASVDTKRWEQDRKHGADVMGPRWPTGKPFPLLVKWLDCRERLSLQVHPPAAVAAELRGEPKTENWYIAHSAPEANLIVGLKRGATRAQFERAIGDNTVEACVHHFRVAAGDSILVRSGQVHAIDAGILILEIQQNSDTTYRVHDWGRVGLDGLPRQLHVVQSLRSIDWTDFEPAPVREACRCTDLRIRDMLRQFTPQERRDMIGDDGRIGVTCEFCSTHRDFDPVEFEPQA